MTMLKFSARDKTLPFNMVASFALAAGVMCLPSAAIGTFLDARYPSDELLQIIKYALGINNLALAILVVNGEIKDSIAHITSQLQPPPKPIFAGSGLAAAAVSLMGVAAEAAILTTAEMIKAGYPPNEIIGWGGLKVSAVGFLGCVAYEVLGEC